MRHEVPRMKSEQATLLVHCRFPTGKGNRVRIVIDGKMVGELDCPLRVSPGDHQVRVTSWGLPLCGAMPVSCTPGASVELALKVCFPGFLLGLAIFVVALSTLAPLAAVLGQHLPGCEVLVVLPVGAAVIATCLLDFYVLLPALSIYTFRLVETGRLHSRA
jgi:hypothetical protein